MMTLVKRISQGGEDRYTDEELTRMHARALLSVSPSSLRAAVGADSTLTPSKRNIVRQFVAALNNEYESRSGRKSHRKKTRAIKRRIARLARLLSPTTVAVCDLVSRCPLSMQLSDKITTWTAIMGKRLRCPSVFRGRISPKVSEIQLIVVTVSRLN